MKSLFRSFFKGSDTKHNLRLGRKLAMLLSLAPFPVQAEWLGAGVEREWYVVLLRENLRRYIAGDRLLNVVDPKKGY